jgi:hypothetical protein
MLICSLNSAQRARIERGTMTTIIMAFRSAMSAILSMMVLLNLRARRRSASTPGKHRFGRAAGWLERANRLMIILERSSGTHLGSEDVDGGVVRYASIY